MIIPTVLVLIFAAMSAYGYHHHHHLQCFDCNNPCSPNLLEKVEGEYSKLLSFPGCEKNIHLADEANPTWECEQTLNMDRTPERVYNATCGECEHKSAKAVPILQDFNMLFRRSCGNNQTYYVLHVKPVTVSLGCMCI